MEEALTAGALDIVSISLGDGARTWRRGYARRGTFRR